MTPKTCDNHRQRDKQINRLKREYIMYKLENKTNNKVVLVLKKINKIYICLNQIQMSYNEAHEQSIIDKYCIVVDSYEIEEIVSMRT